MTTKKDYKRVKPKTSQAKRRKNAKKAQALAKQMRQNGGAPSTYDPHFAEQAKKLCALGATDADLAEFFSVTTVTIWNWATRHQEFFKALHDAKSGFDKRAERALAQRAVGYSYDSEKVFLYKGRVIRAAIKEHIPPDPRAAMHWLTNRDRLNWKDRQETGFDPDQPLKIIVEGGTGRVGRKE